MKRFVRICALGIALMIPDFALASTWKIDQDHSSVGFSVKHLMVSNVRGSFTRFSGTVDLDDRDITAAKVSATIDASSINTNVQKRDDHLRGADFFDVAKYSNITFVSKKWSRIPDGKMKVTGNLAMHGITKQVVLNVEPFSKEIRDAWGKTRRATTATARINRQDFGITWNKALDAGGLTIGDEVDIVLEMELIKSDT
ncbi:MAG: YceI family protein [Chlorobium sp.]|uniref:YceI family protein n=1 Tax=Chlorobium sp. TaxID=1095 RepID=UPI001D4E6392|nr:YceI family protein [Chlorobium sp.]MBN1278482.1 polyisoprenoid-binding protein [Chlorobiaceae bacterium]MCF8215529.1 YceI family protein [Chlorobium sp.]MCF8270417.1 YceI family protein [Chlorobium sp.]MCF8286787.1 YceI family protein [Chlorobium sp.]MCF8290309.1 YceI family protein [Chlorobium sp.]